MLETHPVDCPWCGEPISLPLDPDQPGATVTEDCPVCCRPMQVLIITDGAGTPVIAEVHRDDE